MAFPSTYTDGDFVLLDFNYPYKSKWLDGRGLSRSDTVFSYAEYSRYRQSASRLITTRGTAFVSSTNGIDVGYVPLLAKGDTFSFDSNDKEDGVFVSRTRTGLRVQYYDTHDQVGVGDEFVFAAPSATLMGSLVKKVDKVALSKALNLPTVFERVYNDGGVTIVAGSAVRYDGITGEGVVEIELTDGNASDNNFVGIVQEDILTGKTGAVASVKGPGAWIPYASLASPNDGGLVYLNNDTGGVSHTPGGGSQIIGRLLHEGTTGLAHYILFGF
jgi:hypothetical protein